MLAAASERAPRLGCEEAAAIAREAFGIVGAARDLGSHQDQNFRIEAPGSSYVLKLSNPAFARAELELQNAAMRHVAGLLPGVVPEPLSARDGDDVATLERSGATLHARLLTHLDGAPLRERAPVGGAALQACGALAGAVADALAGFDHPAADRVVQWDVRHAGEVVAALAPQVRAAARRRIAERAAGELAAYAPQLRRQVIHGDVTLWNVLADRDDGGRPVPRRVIDFGDCTRTWLAAECAVLATSACCHARRHPLEDAAEVVGGFHRTLALTEDEIAALPALMAARAALSAVGTEHQAALEPGNPYVARGRDAGWRGLETIATIPAALAHAAFRAACGLPAVRKPRVARPVSTALAGDRPVPVNLSVHTDDLRFGEWRDPRAVRAAVTRASQHGVAVGRWGERRLVRDEGPTAAAPATVHLGVDVFLPEGAIVGAPVAGRVVACEQRAITIAAGAHDAVRLAGLEPEVTAGDPVTRDAPIGRVAAPADGSRLPAHVHVQLTPRAIPSPPTHVPAALATAWLALCPDPGPLLGLTPEQRPPDGDARARRTRFVASPQRLYYGPRAPRIERGWRQWLYDADARPYLDMVNNVAILGHSHPRVEAAAARQLRLLNTNSRFLYDAMGRFAERLVALVPEPLDAVFLLSSGSEANDLALRLARTVTGRADVLCFDGCYHGWTGALQSMRGVTRPTADAAALEDARQAVEELAPAAFISEPFLGNSGGIALPPGFLRELYGAVRAAGGLCVADEVQVGYGRLGDHFWAFEQQGVVPDVVTVAKAAGNGHPVAAVITTREIADAFGAQSDFFASVGGGPVSCEVGIAVLDVLAEERLQERARDVGAHLAGRLEPLRRRHGLVSALHGLGLYRGLELRRPDGSPARHEAGAICERMLELGVIVQPTGPHANVLKLKPPLCFGRADADFLADALDEVLASGW